MCWWCNPLGWCSKFLLLLQTYIKSQACMHAWNWRFIDQKGTDIIYLLFGFFHKVGENFPNINIELGGLCFSSTKKLGFNLNLNLKKEKKKEKVSQSIDRSIMELFAKTRSIMAGEGIELPRGQLGFPERPVYYPMFPPWIPPKEEGRDEYEAALEASEVSVVSM